MRLSPELERKCLELAGEKPKRVKRYVPKAVATPPTGTQERVVLSLPPSANNLFYTNKQGRRVKTRDYCDWIRAVLPACRLLRPPPSYPCVFLYLLTGAVNVQRDGANCEKALTDLAVRAGVIPDDSLKYVRGGCWHWEPTSGPPAVEVWFEDMLPAEGA